MRTEGAGEVAMVKVKVEPRWGNRWDAMGSDGTRREGTRPEGMG